MIDVVEALEDPNLFGPWFAGPSWATWKAVLKAAFALPLTPEELALFRAVSQRDPPCRRVRELWAIVGRRGGKDSIASAVACYAAGFRNYQEVLRPGEAATVLCLAVDKAQAGIVQRYAAAYFAKVPLLRSLVMAERADGLDLKTGAELLVLASNFRGVRGRSIACAIFDECAFWRSETTSNPDVEVYAAVIPSLATIDGAMLIGISTPYRRAGLLWQKHRDHFGQDDDDVLVVQGPSRLFNPTLDQRIVDEALKRDPAAARSEWLAEWRDDIATFVNRELIESAVDVGVTVRPPVPGVSYRAFCDPSGGVSDSFCLAIAHSKDEIAVLDCLLEIPAPFNPTTATGDVAKTLASYGMSQVVGDRYAASWVVDAFSKHGVRYTYSARDRSALYADALPLFTSGRVRLLDNRKLIAQFANLERRTASLGRDRIDHPAGGHDDLSNSAAGVLAALTSGVMFDGFIRYYAELARAERDADPASYVPMRSPQHVGAASGLLGREYLPDADGTFRVHPADVRAFERGGFVLLQNAAVP